MHNYSESQTAAVTIISYKPLSLLCTQDSVPYGSYMPSPHFGVYKPWYSLDL